MKTYNPSKPLISIHIPKCAGSSFSNVLKSWFGKGYLTHYLNEQKNKLPKKYPLHTGVFTKIPKSGLCIHGHFNNARGIGVMDYYPDADQLITIIRNPFDMYLSNYFYVKQLAMKNDGVAYRDGKQQKIIGTGWDLGDYLREVKKSYLCQFLPSNINLNNYKQVLDEKFLFLGITENLQGSVNVLADKFGYPALTVPETNISAWDEDIPDGTLEDFTKNNLLETSIYNYVRDVFERQI